MSTFILAHIEISAIIAVIVIAAVGAFVRSQMSKPAHKIHSCFYTRSTDWQKR